MLETSAFRLPADVLDGLWVYPLPRRFQEELAELNRRWQIRDDRARAPYASLANALSAVTGQPVRILPRTRLNNGDLLMATHRPIAPPVLDLAVSTWEGLCRKGPRGGGGDRADRGVLAPLLDGVTPVFEPLGAAVTVPEPGRVAAEPWLYTVLGWNIARRLASRPIVFDGRAVPFRLDSSGALVAWDAPVIRPMRGGEPARALIRITPHIKTMPGVESLVCILEVSLTRLRDSLYDVRYVWIDHGREHGGSALLRLTVGHRKTEDGTWRVLCDFSADIVAACGLSPLPWGPDVLREHPETVRAGRATNAEHPIGTGVGPRTYRWVIRHAAEMLGVEPVSYEPFRAPGKSSRTGPAVRVPGDIDADRMTPEALDAAIAASGHERLRVVHLTATPDVRDRIRAELLHYQADRFDGLAPDLGVVQPLTERAEVVGYDVADLLAHGRIDRSDLAARAPMLKAEYGTLVLALVETEYDGTNVPQDDAKPRLREALAKAGVASQFLATRPRPEDPERKDYPAAAAVKDLMRVGGLVDGRLARATTLRPYPLDRPLWLVGVHVRRQNSSSKKGRPRLVTVLVAVHASPEPARPWTMHLYAPGQGWLPHPVGVADFHTRPIGPEVGREQDAFAAVRDLVDTALHTLPGDGREPVVVMADADATRRVWPGLGDRRLGGGPLPGDSLADPARVSVVRVSAMDGEIPRPVHRAEGGSRPEDPDAPAQPGGAAVPAPRG